MDEVAVLIGLPRWCGTDCMYGYANTGIDKLCSRSGGCGLDARHVYMRPATALHFKLTGEINHALDHNPQTADASIVR